MANRQLTADGVIDLDVLLMDVERWDTAVIEQLLTKVGLVLAKRKTPSLGGRESELLKAINVGLPADVQSRYDYLRHKLLDEQMMAEEHQELLQLIPIVENHNAEWLKMLVELAQIRQVTLDELMLQLGIEHPPS